MFQQLDLLFSITSLAGPEQMALDEVLLRTIEKPTLRIYRWKGPCVTFGYFQKAAEVRKVFPQQVLVRRWTGGGMVQHGDDITFSLIVPAREPAGKMAPALFYEALHKAMASALQAHQILARLATCDDVAKGEACFEAPALHDLLLENKKILGGAQRRAAGSLLYQGSLQLTQIPGLTRRWEYQWLGSPGIDCQQAARRVSERARTNQIEDSRRQESSCAEKMDGLHELSKAIFPSLASTLSPAVTLINEQPVWLEQAAGLAASCYGSTDWRARR